MWQQVLERWEQDSVHDAFVARCQERGALPQAASYYRRVVDDAIRGAIARRRLQQVAVVAMATLDAARSRPRPPQWWVRWVQAVAALALLLALAFLLTSGC